MSTRWAGVSREMSFDRAGNKKSSKLHFTSLSEIAPLSSHGVYCSSAAVRCAEFYGAKVHSIKQGVKPAALRSRRRRFTRFE